LFLKHTWALPPLGSQKISPQQSFSVQTKLQKKKIQENIFRVTTKHMKVNSIPRKYFQLTTFT